MGRDGLPFLIFALVALSMFLLFLQLPREELSPPRNDPTVLPCKLHNIAKHANDTTCEPFHRSLFPQNFVFGAATAAYQVKIATSGRFIKSSCKLLIFSPTIPLILFIYLFIFDRWRVLPMRVDGSLAFGTHSLILQVT